MAEPDEDDLFELLNGALGDWTSRAYFDWKYVRFPGYDPVEDNFVVTSSTGELIAARRLFQRTVHLSGGETAVAHVHGGTVVREDHRGRGHYSELLAESLAYSRRRADYVFTFNRAGGLTARHHHENGWNHLVLPYHVKVLSPTRVAAEYLLDTPLARAIADVAGSVDARVTRSDRASRAIARAGTLIYGESEVPLADGRAGASTAHEVDVVDEPDADLLRRLQAHLVECIDADHYFERTPEQLRHAASYPGASVYLARERGGTDVDAFLVAGYLEKPEITECRVLEGTWGDHSATRRLFEVVERDARARGADVLIACAEYLPARSWFTLGTQLMMWPNDPGDRGLPTWNDRWRLTVYDIL